ncbi:hypothetical protein DEJ50_00775 [Streptomyces venezuelae]|uniref:Uncharacterized protein n=1 Tax=Streptomyces venezuelae TaxID=54571 RepID=A0A5P2D0G7_STRVZ|nr:hypothetical protein [Streptomyces venezuelae]QES46599.1 hypothetical protein DEJ50_00775 [Streptomyces venezuelae]
METFEVLLSLLAGGSELAGGSDYTWEDLDGTGTGTGAGPEGSRWRCPRNVAGFARSAAEVIGQHRRW